MPVPPPPVPAKLRELLKDYPNQIARLQQVLNAVAEEPAAAPRFEYAIWALEGRVDTFFQEARAELKAATESGDARLIAEAGAKERLMARLVLQKPWYGDKEFSAYFGK